MPFRFGIVTLSECPHLLVRAEFDIDGVRQWGISADSLPNKWFTKNPESNYNDDIAEMLTVIKAAGEAGIAVGERASFFDYWQAMYTSHAEWARQHKIPPLLGGFGASLIERASIDAFCRRFDMPFSRVLRSNALGIRLSAIHPELENLEPADLLPATPLRQVHLRHTVGLTDSFTDAQIDPADKVTDSLPQSLEACIRAYGLTHFKIKLWGDVEKDASRIRDVARVISSNCRNGYAFTVDGNENFKTAAAFREFWASLTADPSLNEFLSRLIFVEQPLHRSVALEPAAMGDFVKWNDRPPVIIDESDGTLTSLREALALGYSGTSHKNCKGIIKGISNACLLEHLRRKNPGCRYELSSEDLTNVGPVALLQDLCVVGNLGITHSERNGQHYFPGLCDFPPAVQEATLAAHSDVFHRLPDGWITAHIVNGILQIGSIVDKGFGANAKIDFSLFTPADQWTYESMMAH